MKVGILGLGEVGQAMKKLCKQKHEVFGRDIDVDRMKGEQLDVIHVCIHWSERFEKIIVDLVSEFHPKFLVICSTVKPGVSESIYKKVKVNLVHAPVIGIHPDLYKYLKVFSKPIGAVNEESYKLAKHHFEELGVEVVRFDSPLETEMAKVLSTTYYAWNILFEKWVYELCRENKVNFDQVYSKWNKIYNLGYRKTKPEVVRPVLSHFPGSIGGHCLMPNVKILDVWKSDSFTKFILKQNEKLK